VQPTRDVILVVTADGEGRSSALERALIDWPELLSSSAALTEGGFILQDFFRAGEEVIAVSRAHKGRLTLEVSTTAVRAPADRPDTATATGRLVHALDRLLRAASTTEPPDVALDTAAALAFAAGGSAALLARNRALAKPSLQLALAADPFTRNTLAHGCVITELNANDLPAIVPESSRATVECGVLPGTSPDELRDELLLAIDDPRVRVRVLDAAPPSASAATSEVVDAWRERVRRERAGAPVLPFVLSRATLAGPLRARGVPTWGFAPIRVDRLEHDAIGGPEERVRTRELEDALSRAVDVIAHLSSSAAGS
jgi:acetylornithine deacetylase/succinyl-diaminopimelate desuccinylase-like protein